MKESYKQLSNKRNKHPLNITLASLQKSFKIKGKQNTIYLKDIDLDSEATRKATKHDYRSLNSGCY